MKSKICGLFSSSDSSAKVKDKGKASKGSPRVQCRQDPLIAEKNLGTDARVDSAPAPVPVTARSAKSTTSGVNGATGGNPPASATAAKSKTSVAPPKTKKNGLSSLYFVFLY